MNTYPKREDVLRDYEKKYGIVDMDRFSWTRLQAPKGKKIIDMGCCYGFMFRDYPHDEDNVTSIDLDDYSHLIPNFIKGDITKTSFKDKNFDVAVITEVLEHQSTWDDSKEVLREACRIGKEVVLTVPNEYLWTDDAEDRFKDWEEVLAEEGGDMTNKSITSAPMAKERDKRHGQYDHIFHHHHFSAEDIERMIKEVTDRSYYIFILPNDGNPETGAIGTTGAIIV